MRAGELRARRAVGVDDAFGQEVAHCLVFVVRLIGREQMIETAILADDDDDVLDRALRRDRVDSLVGI
jgi:hypothetical protein